MNAITRTELAQLDAPVVALRAQRPRRRRRAPTETLIEIADARRRRDPAPLLQARPGRGRQLPRVHGRDRRRARAGAVVLPHADRRHEGHDRQRARGASRRSWCSSCCCRTCPRPSTRATTRSTSGPRSSASASRASRRARQVAPDLSHPAMAVNLDACIQCTRCVRACRDEQVNDVIGLAFRGDAREDRLRHGRPDGRLDLRRLRRMRAGVPDRRADAGARRRAGRARQAGRFGLPVLRRRLPAHLQRQGQQDPLRRRPRRPGQPRAPVRQGPLRLRLRAPPAAPDACR